MGRMVSTPDVGDRDGSPFVTLSPDITGERKQEVVRQGPPASSGTGPSIAIHVVPGEQASGEVHRVPPGFGAPKQRFFAYESRRFVTSV